MVKEALRSVEIYGVSTTDRTRPFLADNSSRGSTRILYKGNELVDGQAIIVVHYPTGPTNDEGIHQAALAQAKILGHGIHNAIAFPGADFAHLYAPVAVDLDAGPNAVAVALLSDEGYCEEIIAAAGIIQPQHIVNIARGSVYLRIAPVNIQESVVVEIADGIGFHPVVVEKARNLGEGFVAIVVEKVMPRAGHYNIYEAVVIEIAHDALQGQAHDGNSAGAGNIGKVPRAVILQQHAGYIVIGDEAIVVAIVVDILKVGSPGLSPDLQVEGVRHFGEVPGAVIDKQSVDAAGVGRIVDALPALGDVEVNVAIVIEIRPDTAIVAGIV